MLLFYGRRHNIQIAIEYKYTKLFGLYPDPRYAEPAIASLRPLAAEVDRQRAPYLFFVMQQKQVGLGFEI